MHVGLGSHLHISLCQKCRCDPFFTAGRKRAEHEAKANISFRWM
jgi:hypothetical protein